MKVNKICLAVLCGLLLAGCDNKQSSYESAVSMVEEKNYSEAIGLLEDLGDYEDSDRYLKEAQAGLEKQEKIENDKENPVINGIENVKKIELDRFEYFNLKDHLQNELEVSDNVTAPEDLKWGFSSTPGSLIDDKGIVDTNKPGQYDVDIRITDERGNVAIKSIELEIGIVRLSKDSINTVIYDGEYGKVTFVKASSRDTTLDGDPVVDMQLEFQLDNDNSIPSRVGLTNTYINNMKVDSFTNITNIDPGRSGISTSYLYLNKSRDQDWTEIEGELRIFSDEYYYVSIPVIINRNVFS